MIDILPYIHRLDSLGYARTESDSELVQQWRDLYTSRQNSISWQVNAERNKALRFGHNPEKIYGSLQQHYHSVEVQAAQNFALFSCKAPDYDQQPQLIELKSFGEITGAQPPAPKQKNTSSTSSVPSVQNFISPDRATAIATEFAQQKAQQRQTSAAPLTLAEAGF